MLPTEVFFWLSAFATFYPYVGYPLALRIISFFVNAPVKESDLMPSVSLVISAFNEECVLPKKIENSLALDYPGHLLEIAVLSDGSTDGTNDIIRHFAEKSDNILPCIFRERKGKTACLNEVVPYLRSEIVVFSDSNSFYDKDLIRRIVRPFADPRIGLVTGRTQYVRSSDAERAPAAGFYSRLERLTKSLETQTGSCVGADGAVFAIRRSLFSPLRPDDINDLVIPFHIVSKGYRCILDPSVVCVEEASDHTNEFQRQIRITVRTLRAIFRHKDLLNPYRHPLFSFKLFSHKVMKFVAPFSMAALLTANVFSAVGGGILYRIILLLQAVFYGCALIGFSTCRRAREMRWVGPTHLFLTVNIAYALGWIHYFRGETFTTWKPHR